DAITHIDNFLRVDESVSENNWALNLNIFVQIDDLTKIALIESQLQAYKEIQNQAREDLQANRFYLDSFEGIAARSQEERIRNNDLHRGLPKAAVVAPSIMALILLLIACFNFTNTSIAISSRRLKEIGIRKVLGSQRRQLIFQFLTENILICFLGLLTGLVLAEFIVPAYSNMWPFLEFEINYLENLDFFIFMIVLLLFTGVFSGGYPAFYISSFQPTTILKGNASFAGTNLFTKTLLFLQYTSCILALILGFAFMENAKYQQEMDFGYETHGILSHRLNSGADFEKYRNALIQNPGILHVTGSRHHIFSNWYNDPIKYETNEVETDIMDVSYDYLETMNIELLQGRNFIKDSKTDNQESVVVNEEFVKTFNWKDPIGKKLIWRDSVQLYVVGVIKDFYTRAYFGPISPMMFKFALPEDYRQIIIKTNPGNIMAVNEFAEKEYRKTFPNYLYKGQIMDKELEDSARTNINIVKLFFFLAIIALILTTIGLYSLVSLNILKRMKEIGVRKVMGASVLHIVGKLNKEFVIILSLSSLAGIPLAYKVTDIFMGLIWEYYQSPTVLTISLSVLLLFVVSGITLGTKVFAAARSNPVNVLRIS
ncbi:MAG: FtsX-like permease family protein, partial [Cyclobacteriaceae bacterium]|nr:FtsX-like permease family protein [Cyclobacteriaceae bacterium]